MTTPPEDAVDVTSADPDVPAPEAGSVDAGDGDSGDGRPVSTPDAKGRKKPRSGKRVVVEWLILVGGALLIAFLIKTFLFQAFWIPSESMLPTLEEGDRVLVNKLSYDLHDVHREDIVVFENPQENSGVDDLVKRVVALPGETLELRDGAVFVNGERLDEGYTEGISQPLGSDGIPNCEEQPALPDTCTVPAGRVFVMGDNRQQSEDSRAFGPIEESSIVGRVFVRIWPVSRLGLL